MTINKLTIECSVCKDWKGEHNFYTPTTKERREYHYQDHKKLSHGLCPECYGYEMIELGVDPSELEKVLNVVKYDKNTNPDKH
jgi:hypothetical protein